MGTVILAFGALTALIVLLSLSIIVGREIGKWQMSHDTKHRLGVVDVAEGTVFALLGLLVAFTFSGAYERFEARQLHIIEEANAIETAYMRLDLLTLTNHNDIRDLFREYIDARLTTYSKMIDFKQTKIRIAHARELQLKIWDQVLAACKAQNDGNITQLVIPPLNNMIDIANTRLSLTRVHPPLAIFELLIGLAVLSTLLAGYSTAKKEVRSSIHLLSYVFIMALTLFLIINLEFPRVGLIKLDAFDKILIDVKDHLR